MDAEINGMQAGNKYSKRERESYREIEREKNGS